ncbi:hypothetical protein PLANPX_0560 [Lacipirellula parvula]|uniref:Uncharacterized protein n=1 Tax=Lacipirellula parvula TaxID=2650471 RepID=A0A5K7X2S0_9BACT|nr:hypothetical protein PLANPX_0560 [Lacipirellula parvula]
MSSRSVDMRTIVGCRGAEGRLRLPLRQDATQRVDSNVPTRSVGTSSQTAL